MPWRTIFTFTHPQGGWSEIYFNNLASDAQAAYDAALALANARIQLSAAPVILSYIRQSNELIPRDTSITSVQLPADLTWQSRSDVGYNAAMVRLYGGASGYSRTVFIRGIPDNVYDLLTAGNVDETVWRQRFNNTYLPVILSGQWFVKSRDRESSNPKKAITNIAANVVNGRLVYTYSALDTPPNVGSYVILYGVKGAKPAPGLVKVVAVDATAKEVNVDYVLPRNYFFAGTPTWRSYFPRYSLITTANIVKVTHRIIGRPFGLSRGRRVAIPRQYR